ncbi:B3 domain-containing protein At5g26805-like [Coffea arabica]|uniref:B3 domain-containing protein At5g26805-like n=1 Tax=Coffea arabica TaxID=13443 RepID=A0ABM4W347_COFAR
MVKHIFYHFLETKEKEEENRRCDLQLGHPRSEFVERNNRSPQLLYLFPWEIKKVISTHDLQHQIGLELNAKQVKEHLLIHWDGETKGRVINGERIPIQMLDLDTRTEYQVFFTKWPNHDMYLILGSWFMEFVANRNVTSGMTIGLYWDKKSKTLRVSVLDKFI